MTNLETLRAVLEVSVERNGEKPLTNAYLLNIVKMVQRVQARRQESIDHMLDEAMGDDKKWGSS